MQSPHLMYVELSKIRDADDKTSRAKTSKMVSQENVVRQ